MRETVLISCAAWPVSLLVRGPHTTVPHRVLVAFHWRRPTNCRRFPGRSQRSGSRPFYFPSAGVWEAVTRPPEQVPGSFLAETPATKCPLWLQQEGFTDFSDVRKGKIISGYNTVWNMLPFASETIALQ